MSETTSYPDWRSAALGHNLLSHLWANRPSLGQMVPESRPDDPGYLTALDYASLPGRGAWALAKGLYNTISNATADALRSPNLLQDRHAQHQLTEAMLNVAVPSVAAPLRPAGSLGVFGGVGAANANQVLLRRAEEMLARGAEPKEVWAQTGWYKGTEGKMKFEIPDRDASINPQFIQERPDWEGNPAKYAAVPYSFMGPPTRLGDILEHKALYDAYPELKNTVVNPASIADIFSDTLAYYMPSTGEITMRPGKSDQFLSSLLHEIQHKLQHREGFARGGNTSEFLPAGFADEYKKSTDAMEAFRDHLRRAGMNPFVSEGIFRTERTGGQIYDWHQRELERLGKNMSPAGIKAYKQAAEGHAALDDLRVTAFENYQNLAGEAEARMAQERQNYRNMQRRMTYPPDTDKQPPQVIQGVQFNTQPYIAHEGGFAHPGMVPMPE